MHYLHGILPSVSVLLATGALITLFLFLVMSGISELSIVAIIIFVLHIVSMVTLIGSAIWYVSVHGLAVAPLNFKMPAHGSFATALFLGFSTAMLGIFGFESSANFVEEQEIGVFRKTLRNMWITVSVINVGTFAVQIAHILGATVTDVCSTKNMEMVKSPGASHVLDYTLQDFSSLSGQFDIIFYAAGKANKSICRRMLISGGKFVTVNSCEQWQRRIGRNQKFY